MNDLQILLLGPPEIRWKGELLPIKRRIPRALLFYLASRGHLVTRNELLVLFWPDISNESARARLRETLSRLRQALPVPDILLTNGDLVGLEFSKAFIDQHEFQRLLDEIGQLPWKIPVNEALPEKTYQNLLSASRLWRSTRFLAGVDLPSSYELDNWQLQVSQHYEHLYRHILERLSHHAQALGDLEHALRYIRLALENDPLDETLHGRVLELLLAADQIEEARSYYAQVEELLDRELGAQPGTQLTEISHRLYLSVPLKTEMPPAIWHIRHSLDVPFVGRQSVLSQLWRCYQQNTNVILFGETGSGKTRVMREFVTRLVPSPRCLVVRCTPTGDQVPFQTFLDGERHYGLLRGVIKDMPEIYARQLLLLMPELSDAVSDLNPSVPASLEQDNLVLFEAFRQYLILITKKERLVVVLDDVQWADDPLLQAAAYLLERSPCDRHVMIIVAGRREEGPPLLEKMIHSWQSAGRMQSIDLPRMSLAEVHNLTSAVLPQTPPPQFVEQLAQETGSNPYFILETLREMVEQNMDVSQALPLPLATNMGIVIRSRLHGLTSVARQLIEVAAVIGSEFELELLKQAAQMREDAFNHAFAELDVHGLIEVQPDQALASYCFVHEKFREILLIELKPHRAQALHNNVTKALNVIYKGRIPRARLAFHYEKAGNLARAFENWLQAGLDSYRLQKLFDAEHLLGQAENLIPLLKDELEPKKLYQLYHAQKIISLKKGDFSTLEEIGDNLLRAGQQLGNSLLIGAALNNRAVLYQMRYQYAEGLSVIEQALPYLKQADDVSEYIEAQNLKGSLLYMSSRLEDSLQVFEQSLAIGETVEIQTPAFARSCAQSHEQIALLQYWRGWPQECQLHAQQALADAITAQDLPYQASSYNVLSLARFSLGEYAQARVDNDLGLRLAESLDHWHLLGHLNAVRAMIELNLGNLTASIQCSIQVLELGQKYRYPDVVYLGYRNIGDVYAMLNAHALALDYYQHSQEYGKDSFWGIDILHRIGHVYGQMGQIEKAFEYVQEAITSAHESGMSLDFILAQLSRASLLLQQGNLEAARQLADEMYIEATNRSLIDARLTAILLLGEIAWQMNEIGVACHHLETVAERSFSLSFPWQELRARSILAQIHRGDSSLVESQYQRIQFLLEHIEQVTCDDDYPLDNIFQEYQRNILE